METILNVTTDSTTGETLPSDNCEKQKLAEEIERLRTVLVESRTTAKKTKNELKAIRRQLKQRQRELRQERIIASVLPRLKRKLKTREAAYAFLQSVAADFNLVSRSQDGGILVLEPEARAEVAESGDAAPPVDDQAAAVDEDEAGSGAAS